MWQEMWEMAIDAWKTTRFMCKKVSKTKGRGRGDDKDEGGGGLDGRSVFCPGGFRWTRAKCFKGLTPAYTLCSNQPLNFLKALEQRISFKELLSLLVLSVCKVAYLRCRSRAGLKRYRRFPGDVELISSTDELRFMQHYFTRYLRSYTNLSEGPSPAHQH